MRIEQLIYLVEIADAGSFSAAASRLHVTQPSISQSISSLENELGLTLLLRTRTGVKPTPAGIPVIEKSRHILSELQELRNMSQNATRRKHSINIVAGVVPISILLPNAIASSELYENGYTVNIQEGSSKDAEKLLNDGKADFAIVAYVEVPFSGDFLFTPLLTSHMMALVSIDSPLAKKDILTYQEIQPYPISLVADDYPSSQAALLKISSHGTANISLRTQNVALMQSRVESSNVVGLVHDISFAPSSYVNRSSRTILIPIQDCIDLNFGILSKRNRIYSVMEKRLISELKKAAARYQI